MAGKLKDKRVLVTGGGTGIGREIAQVFLSEGARVVICGRRHGPLKETVDELAVDGRMIHFIECDISDPTDVQTMVEKTIGLLSGLDILVNNAGIYEGGNIETASLKGWDLSMAVNLRGAFLTTKLCLPHLKNAGRGSSVLNISSSMASQIEQHTLPYAVSKAGLETFTRCCAIDYGEAGIRFNAISPGVVDTPMQDHNKGELGYQEWRTAMEHIHPLKAIGVPKDVATAALYLSSADADWLTGVILQVDGGLTAQ
ncbi:MAG: SDR family oxidoreductase [Planctomycetes bacterium]|nr:SDR family oxidoreductase [Planctomycetota bacterium]